MTELKAAYSRFLCGFGGGLCVYLAKLAMLTARGDIAVGTDFPHIGALYVLGVVATAALGGIVSYALESHNVLIALYHGATAPTLFAFLSHVPR